MDLLTEAEMKAREKHDASAKAVLESANRRNFERECKSAGIDPAKGVSPSLLNILSAG